MNLSRLVLLFALTASLLSGCQSVPANKPAVTYVPPPTSLVITVENEDMTEAEYKARRDELIAYLIERGYIQSEADLVADSASAGRLIRATLGADGGFKLSVYNLENEAVAESPAVSSYGVYASYSIPAYYYGDYYYYGFAPVPFYGYASWPAYYPIYPTYPVCVPPKPVAPYCSPGGSYRYRDWCPQPTSYVNCAPRSKPVTNWAWCQSYPNTNWTKHNRYARGSANWHRDSGQSPGQPEIAAATTATALAATAASNRGNRHNNQNRNSTRRAAPAGDNAAPNNADNDTWAPTPDRVRTPSNQAPRTAGQGVRPYNPDRRPDGQANRPTMPATARNSGDDQRAPNTYPRANVPDNRNTAARPNTPDRRPTMPNTARNSGQESRQPNANPRANVPENRNNSARPGNPDNRPRNYTPDRTNNSPRPANIATNTRPSPAQTSRQDSAPRSAPAPRYQPSGGQNHSNPPPSSSGSRSAPSARESSNTSQEAAR